MHENVYSVIDCDTSTVVVPQLIASVGVRVVHQGVRYPCPARSPAATAPAPQPSPRGTPPTWTPAPRPSAASPSPTTSTTLPTAPPHSTGAATSRLTGSPRTSPPRRSASCHRTSSCWAGQGRSWGCPRAGTSLGRYYFQVGQAGAAAGLDCV